MDGSSSPFWADGDLVASETAQMHTPLSLSLHWQWKHTCVRCTFPSMCVRIYTRLTSLYFHQRYMSQRHWVKGCSAHSAHFHDCVSVTDYVFVHVWTPPLCWCIYIPLYTTAYTACLWLWIFFALCEKLFCICQFIFTIYGSLYLVFLSFFFLQLSDV